MPGRSAASSECENGNRQASAEIHQSHSHEDVYSETRADRIEQTLGCPGPRGFHTEAQETSFDKASFNPIGAAR
jgi:hypothetical protein